MRLTFFGRARFRAHVPPALPTLARVRLQRLSPIGNRRNPPPRAENAANFFRSSARAAQKTRAADQLTATSVLFCRNAIPSAPVCERPVMTFVYRYYDQAELERQLNARATVPDITPILARYASESARMRARLPCQLSVSYGASEPERLDIFPAATKEPAPIFVFLHGGYWRLLDSADSCFMAECFTKAGACVVAVTYALAPLVTLAEIVRQSRAAIAWVHAHARDFGGDPTRIHVSGSSAGGHLAAMMLAPGWHA